MYKHAFTSNGVLIGSGSTKLSYYKIIYKYFFNTFSWNKLEYVFLDINDKAKWVNLLKRLGTRKSYYKSRCIFIVQCLLVILPTVTININKHFLSTMSLKLK